jgi:hypothetical protein
VFFRVEREWVNSRDINKGGYRPLQDAEDGIMMNQFQG